MIIPDNGHLTKITKGKYSEDVLYAENHILEEIKIYVQSNYHVVEMKLKPMYVISSDPWKSVYKSYGNENKNSSSRSGADGMLHEIFFQKFSKRIIDPYFRIKTNFYVVHLKRA